MKSIGKVNDNFHDNARDSLMAIISVFSPFSFFSLLLLVNPIYNNLKGEKENEIFFLPPTTKRC